MTHTPQEKLAAVLADMRRTTPGDDDHIEALLASYADRIESALPEHGEGGEAVVTDEDVERAADAFLANTGQEHKVTPFQRSLTIQCMRPALESFVRKQTASEQAALERV